jgi:hypothetical protein
VVLGFLGELVGSLLVQLTDLVELLHVLEEVWTPLQGDKKLGLLAVTSLVVSSVAGGLNCDGLGSDLLECSVIVSTQKSLAPTCASQETLTNFKRAMFEHGKASPQKTALPELTYDLTKNRWSCWQIAMLENGAL